MRGGAYENINCIDTRNYTSLGYFTSLMGDKQKEEI